MSRSKALLANTAPGARALLASCLLLGIGAAARAQEPSIVIRDPWLRATPKGAPVIGGYATITNRGTSPERLVGASLPVASGAKVHTMTMDNGVMRMRALDGGLPIAPGATVTLSPGGTHLMFGAPTAQVREGTSLAGTLVFEHAGAVPVTFAVGAIGAKAAPGAAAASKMDHHGMDMPAMDRSGMDKSGH